MSAIPASDMPGHRKLYERVHNPLDRCQESKSVDFKESAPWNNLGTAYYDVGQYLDAKVAWEKALIYLPEDAVATDNLNEFIYDNPNILKEIKGSHSIH